MARPYQQNTRAEIAACMRDNDAERARLQALLDELDRADEALTGRDDQESMRRSLAINTQYIAINDQVLALLEDAKAMNFELHVRNSPDLVAKLGPGAD